MSPKSEEKPQKRPSNAELLQPRLAKALRANLKRRKALKTKPSRKPDAAGE